jgi:hypothetical protein
MPIPSVVFVVIGVVVVVVVVVSGATDETKTKNPLAIQLIRLLHNRQIASDAQWACPSQKVKKIQFG